MNVDGVALAPGIDRAYHLRAIREAGAGSVRWSIDWATVQPHRSWDEVPENRRQDFTDVDGAPMDLRATDRFVAAAARVRLRLLPVINTSAPWASENPYATFAPPADIAGRLVHRADDTKEAVDKRIAKYHSETAPIIPFYKEKGILKRVDGVGEPDVVTSRLKDVLKS
jgi:adenylate kinase family enzyme